MKHLLIPLGNPGKKYEWTRHNAARVVLSHIHFDRDDVEVVTLTSFMNESGREISEILRMREGVVPVIIYDDKDLPIGSMRIAYGRGDGGHNGVKSVISALGSRDFLRIRIGIAPKETDGITHRPPHGDVVQTYVLGILNEEEKETLSHLAEKVESALVAIIEEGYQKAMEVYNR